MDRKKLIIAGIGAAVLIAAGTGFFLKSKQGGNGGSGGPGGQGARGGASQQASVTIVKAEPPTTGDLSLTTGLTGTVEAADVVYVYAKASGDVTAVQVKAGDMVTQGQVLCEIDTEQVDTAKNSMDSAQLKLSETQSDLSRMQILYNGGDLSDQEYEKYTNSLKSAQLSYESAKLNYERQVEYSTITAPIAGRIESCDVEVYDRIGQSSQLCVIAGEGESRITFYVTQRMIKNLKEGDALTVTKNGASYEGWISEISSMVDEATGLFKVKAELENTDELAIGSTVKINLVTDRAENAMLIPVDAVYYSGGDAYVYLYEDGTAKMTQIQVGLYDSEYAEVLSGLEADNMVVSTWSSNLYEGAKIRLKGDEASESFEGQDGSNASGGQNPSDSADGQGAPHRRGQDGGQGEQSSQGGQGEQGNQGGEGGQKEHGSQDGQGGQREQGSQDGQGSQGGHGRRQQQAQ